LNGNECFKNTFFHLKYIFNQLVKNILKYSFAFLILVILSSCATPTIDPRQVIPELFDQELKKGKIFVFSNHVDIRPINIRVNDEVRQMKHTQTEIFDLKEGQNSVFSFMIFGGNEQENCEDQPYTFDTEMFPEIKTYYFVIQSGFEGTVFTIRCFKDFEVNEEVFLNQIKNPRSGSNEFLQDLTEDFFREFVF
tara:strand:+ start:38 stop:619 length:582 start_codon:yes stop_codon:yes gene_type:complete